MGTVKDPILWDDDFDTLRVKAIAKLQELDPTYTQVMPSDPGVAVIEAASYVLDLLGIALNRLPQASLVSWINYVGLETKAALASKAVLTLTFDGALISRLVVPEGAVFLTGDGLEFLATSETVFPVGSTTGEVEVECSTAGTIGNVAAGTITSMSQPLPQLAYWTNPLAATGGTNTELDAVALERGRKLIRHLWRAVAPDDWEQIALGVQGIERAKCIDVPGQVDLYVLPSDNQALEGELMTRTYLAVDSVRIEAVPWQLHEAVRHEVNVVATVKLLPGYGLDTVQSLAEAALSSFLDPYSWIWGRKVPRSELQLELEGVPGVDYVEELALPAENVRMEPFELATLGTVTLYAQTS